MVDVQGALSLNVEDVKLGVVNMLEETAERQVMSKMCGSGDGGAWRPYDKACLVGRTGGADVGVQPLFL